jgi:hypothetical protein
MGRLEVLASPRLKHARGELAGYLRNARFDAVFLPLTPRLEPFLRMFLEGVPYEELRYPMSRLVSGPSRRWEEEYLPIFKALREAFSRSPRISIYLYGGSELDARLAEVTSQMTSMLVRGLLSDEVDSEAWRAALEKYACFWDKSLHEKCDLLEMPAMRHNLSICIYEGLGAGKLAEALRGRGIRVRVLYFGTPHVKLPIDVLKSYFVYLRGEIGDREIRELIRAQLRFLKEYVMRSKDLEEAYRKWVLDNYGFLSPALLAE